MQLFAQWTNLSETTFLLPPDHRRRRLPAAHLHRQPRAAVRRPPDARQRARVARGRWYAAAATTVVQECGAGLVTIARGDRLALRGAAAAPGRARSSDADLDHVTRALRHHPRRHRRRQVVRQRPGLGRRTPEGRPTPCSPCGPTPPRSTAGHRRRRPLDRRRVATPTSRSAPSTPHAPRTRSPAASTPSLGQWLAGTRLPEQYVAAQGTAIGRAGRVHVRREGSTVWVGGDTRTTLRGEATV